MEQARSARSDTGSPLLVAFFVVFVIVFLGVYVVLDFGNWSWLTSITRGF
jgi:hypothetical protein